MRGVGKWIKYKSKYSSLRSERVLSKAGLTFSGRWNVHQSFDVINKSFLVTIFYAIALLIALPTST